MLKRNKFRNLTANGNFTNNSSPNRLLPKFEGPKWNPDRIVSSTLFIMGARANKVLGYGQNRGRLYVRHPDLMRYSGDQEDKDWLSRHNLLPANGGKAYLMVLEDIKELSSLDEYRNSPNLLLSELKGFEAPIFMVNKIRQFMEQVRTDGKAQLTNFDIYDFQNCQSMTPPGNVVDSGPPTPSDTLNMLDPNQKQSDLNMYINAPEISPGSNSFLTQSPSNLLSSTQTSQNFTNDVTTTSTLQSTLQQRNNLTAVQHNTLSAFLSGQISSDNSQDDSEF